MNFILKAILLSAPLLQGPIPDQARPQLQILLLNGVTGKPIPKVRLLIFAGSTPEEVQIHAHSFDLTTNEEGLAKMPSGQMWPSSLQIFVDFMTGCQPQPNLHSFSLSSAMKDGLTAANSCGSVQVQAKPGQLILFARKPTFRERMSW